MVSSVHTRRTMVQVSRCETIVEPGGYLHSVRLLQIRSVLTLLGRGPCVYLIWTFAGSILVLYGLAASSRWPSAGYLGAQVHSLLSQYQASYPAILDIATYLSLNKLFGGPRGGWCVSHGAQEQRGWLVAGGPGGERRSSEARRGPPGALGAGAKVGHLTPTEQRTGADGPQRTLCGMRESVHCGPPLTASVRHRARLSTLLAYFQRWEF
jgi:hypothetical protein